MLGTVLMLILLLAALVILVLVFMDALAPSPQSRATAPHVCAADLPRKASRTKAA